MTNITLLNIGYTGTGKSSLGNLLLGRVAFAESDSPTPCTTHSIHQSATLSGVTRNVIDTQGLEDGQNESAEQAIRLGVFLKNWELGINAIVVVINGQHPRFDQGVQNMVRFAYNCFGTPNVVNNICIVFTRCFEIPQCCPNLAVLESQYRSVVQNFLVSISNVPNPNVPVFFVDTKDANGARTRDNVARLLGWAAFNQLLDSKKFKAVSVTETIVEKIELGACVGSKIQGGFVRKLFVNRKRDEITPNNGGPKRYSDWVVTKSWDEEDVDIESLSRLPYSVANLQTRRAAASRVLQAGESRGVTPSNIAALRVYVDTTGKVYVPDDALSSANAHGFIYDGDVNWGNPPWFVAWHWSSHRDGKKVSGFQFYRGIPGDFSSWSAGQGNENMDNLRRSGKNAIVGELNDGDRARGVIHNFGIEVLIQKYIGEKTEAHWKALWSIPPPFAAMGLALQQIHAYLIEH